MKLAHQRRLSCLGECRIVQLGGCAAGTQLVKRAIHEMVLADADEVVLEAEVTNKGALALYQNLGFLRDKRLLR